MLFSPSSFNGYKFTVDGTKSKTYFMRKKTDSPLSGTSSKESWLNGDSERLSRSQALR